MTEQTKENIAFWAGVVLIESAWISIAMLLIWLLPNDAVMDKWLLGLVALVMIVRRWHRLLFLTPP